MNELRWNRLRYTGYAPLYDTLVRPLSSGRRRTIELAAPRSSQHVLIVGAGTGLDLPYLPQDARITAVDLTPAMLHRAAARGTNLQQAASFSVMNGQELAFADATFDYILLHLILAVVPDPHACIREAARVLKPGGRISIFDKFLPDHASASSRRRVLNRATHFLFSDINRQLGPLLASAGLVTLHDEPVMMQGAYRIVIATHAASNQRSLDQPLSEPAIKPRKK